LRKLSWKVYLSFGLIGLSILIFVVQYALLHDSYDIGMFLLYVLDSVPLDVLIFYLILDELLSRQEKSALLVKLNMVIGTFFSEVGLDLLKFFSQYDSHAGEIREQLVVTDNWATQEFYTVKKFLKDYTYSIECQSNDFEELRAFLLKKRMFMLALLENPNLLEHESFTDMLRADFHLTEELGARTGLQNIPKADYDHLVSDTRRAYTFTVSEWLDYMKHLKKEYPYLFSLAMRTNPFDPNANPVIA